MEYTGECLFLYACLWNVSLPRSTSVSGSLIHCVYVGNYAPQLCRQALLRHVLAMGILSVCLSVTTRYGFNARWDRDSGSSPYDSLESLISYEVIWCQRGRRFPSNEGIKEGYSHPPLEFVILPLLAHLAWKRLQIDADLLPIITRTADELSSGTNINDLERPLTSKIGVF